MNRDSAKETLASLSPHDSAEWKVALARVLGSPGFEASERLRRFLEYVVEESINGRSGSIKAYTIAVDVFGRGADFDPNTDPIVRIEAGRLRRALERYYLTAGASDPLIVEIPKGGYAPKFRQREKCAGPEISGRPRSETKQSIAVVPLADLAG